MCSRFIHTKGKNWRPKTRHQAAKGYVSHVCRLTYKGEPVISAESDVSEVSIKVDVLGLRGVKLGGEEASSALSFDVNAKLEEKERRSGRLVVSFVLTVGTKPSVVKFEVEGMATLEGKNPAIERLLEADPKTKVPLLLHRVYQRVFTSTFLLATLLDTPYPPPDLLFSGEMGKQGLEGSVEWEEKEEKGKVEEKPKEKEESVEKAKEAVKAKKVKPKPRR